MSFLATTHKTFVHHVALDPSGTLMATCSSDKTVEVFHRRQGSGGEDLWERGCTMDDHTGPVLRLAWCQHREHGPLLSTAAADHWIFIYRITVSTHEGRTVTQSLRWSPVRGFEKDAITDVAFIPPQQYHVLLLSTASLDGCVRLYEIHQPLQFPCLCKLTPEADFPTAEEAGTQRDRPGVAGEQGSRASTSLVGAGGTGAPGAAGGYRVAAAALQPRGSGHAAGPSFANSLPSISAGSGVSAASGGGGGGGGAGEGAAAGASGAAQNTGFRGSGGIISISWFPGAAESTMTLAVGAVSGRFFLYRYLKDSITFIPLRLMDAGGRTGYGIDGTAGIRCRLPVEDVEWAPPMGRRFQLCAICSRAEVYILRLNCISPSNHDMDAEGPISFEVFHHPAGAVSASWSRSSTMLYLTMDDRSVRMTVLQMRDPRDHSSWEIVSQNSMPPC